MTVYDAFLDELDKLGFKLKIPKAIKQLSKKNAAALWDKIQAQKSAIRGRADQIRVQKRAAKRFEVRANRLNEASKAKTTFKHRGRKAEMKLKARKLMTEAGRRHRSIDRHLKAISTARAKVDVAQQNLGRIRKIRFGAGAAAVGTGMAGGTAALMAAQKALTQV